MRRTRTRNELTRSQVILKLSGTVVMTRVQRDPNGYLRIGS